MDLNNNSTDSIISLEHYTISNIKLKETARQLIFNSPEKLKEKNENGKENGINENILNLEEVKKLTNVVDSLIHRTNLKSKVYKKAFKNACEVKEKNIPIELVNHEYLRNNLDTHYIRYHLNLNEIKYVILSTLSIDQQWSYINNSISQDNKDYISKVHQFGQVKKSFLQFIDYTENRIKNIKDEVNTEIANTKLQKNKLEKFTDAYEGVENKVQSLMERIMIPEGCYMILMWLSPLDWKKKFNIDIDFSKYCNDDYRSYAYQKPLEEFAKEVRLEPVLEMYWESEEQFTKKLIMLDKKTRNNMSILGIINNSHKMSSYKQQNNDSNYKKKLSQNIVSNLDGINQILTSNNQTNLEHIKSIKPIFYNKTLFNIKRMSLDICTELNKPYGDLTRPSQVMKSLFNQIYKILNYSDQFPKTVWRITEKVLQLIEESKAKKYLHLKSKCGTVNQTQREANKMYDLPPTNVRVQKLLPNRLMMAKQKPPKKPKKPTLNNDQLMYLKCFTYLSPIDITSNNIASVPEFKM